jgi:hypothetical protein
MVKQKTQRHKDKEIQIDDLCSPDFFAFASLSLCLFKKETMIIHHEESDSQLDIPERGGRHSGVALLDAMIPAATAWARTPAKPVPQLDTCSSRWVRSRAMDPARPGRTRELSPILARSTRSGSSDSDHQHAVTNAYPGTHDTSTGISQRGLAQPPTARLFSGITHEPDRGKEIGCDTQLTSCSLRWI